MMCLGIRSQTGFLALVALLVTVGSGAMPATGASAVHPVEGRFSIQSDAGGAVWSFQPEGGLTIIGPGELLATGTWTAGPGDREFDATVDVRVTGQQLEVLGTVAPDGQGVAVAVLATEATDPDAGVPWPERSQLVGQRLGMASDSTPAPSPTIECLRPSWTETGEVDWDRCDDLLTAPDTPGPAEGSPGPG